MAVPRIPPVLLVAIGSRGNGAVRHINGRFIVGQDRDEVCRR